MGSGTINDFFAEELSDGVSICALGKTTVEYSDLDSQEEAAIRKVFNARMKHIRNVSPKLYEGLKPQENAFVKWGMVAKSVIPNDQPIRYPGEPGSLGVDWLNPALHMSNAVEATSGQYTDYADSGARIGRVWDITCTAGTTVHPIGEAGNYYKASIVTDKREFIVIAQDGILEVGTTPTCTQVRITTEANSKYSPINVSPVWDQTVEDDRQIFQYPTLGMIPLYHNFGTKVALQPGRTTAATMPLIGMAFYEYGLYSSLLYT